jgi:hypothetical protein
MSKYRKKPVVVEAFYYMEDRSNQDLAALWCGGRRAGGAFELIAIDTLEGTMYANPGDWIIRGVKGEFYPCKSDIFDATYEKVEDDLSV